MRLLSKRRFFILISVLFFYLSSFLLVLHNTMSTVGRPKVGVLLPNDVIYSIVQNNRTNHLDADVNNVTVRVVTHFSKRSTTAATGQNSSHLGLNNVSHPLPQLERIDWNDYSYMAMEAQRSGEGEQGKGYYKSVPAVDAALSEWLFNQYKFNAYASDRIALDRSIGDIRTDVCKKKLFLKNIPDNSVSIISIFNNEKNSTLLRTVHGLVNRSPKRLLREIILVDDNSTNEELKAPLDDYLKAHFTNVRLIRNQGRQGLIKSRIIGANASSGEFLVFLDAHTEVNHNYLPPLLEPIILDYRTIVCPMIDIIADRNLQIRPLVDRERGAFDWGMSYQRLPVFQEDASEPHPVPTMVGCAMAISRKWWEEIGMYDSGLEIWGGEQYEISFKSWQCGGKVVDAPCSRVAHLFRKLPYATLLMDNKIDDKNFLRVASVWMDEYKEYLLQRRPAMRNLDPGDLTNQIAVRQRLKCKSFDWYMHEVAPDILHFFPPVEPPVKAWGRLRSRFNRSLCVLTEEHGFAVDGCEKSGIGQYEYDWRLHLRRYDQCFANPGSKFVFMYTCLIFEHRPTQMFVWDRVSGKIVNSFTHLCLDYDVATLKVYIVECADHKTTQSWTFDGYNATLVDDTWNMYKEQLTHNVTVVV